MASKSLLLFKLPHLLTLFFLTFLNNNTHQVTCSYTSIFSFGDSLSDTGNLLYSQRNRPSHVSRPPYGETYFHRPTGRFCDGRLILDFIAQAIGVPLLPPYLAGSSPQDFRQGANFAVAGAKALDDSFFNEKGIHVDLKNESLSVQIDWFKQLLPSLCSVEDDCQDFLSKSLFIVGEIGGNDYNHPLFQGRTLDEIRTFVPHTINAISSAVNDLIELGARTLVVPGNLPIGCASRHLAYFGSPERESYETPLRVCISWLNEFTEYHNNRLQDELDRVRGLHPYATIIYANIYDVAMSIYSSPSQFGFKAELAACCGGGGPFNYNVSAECGDKGSKGCDDPSSYICWDGMHFTEAANKIIAVGLLEGPYAIPPIANTCSHLAFPVDS